MFPAMRYFTKLLKCACIRCHAHRTSTEWKRITILDFRNRVLNTFVKDTPALSTNSVLNALILAKYRIFWTLMSLLKCSSVTRTVHLFKRNWKFRLYKCKLKFQQLSTEYICQRYTSTEYWVHLIKIHQFWVLNTLISVTECWMCWFCNWVLNTFILATEHWIRWFNHCVLNMLI